jgi:hypothetical protein
MQGHPDVARSCGSLHDGSKELGKLRLMGVEKWAIVL